MLKITTLFIEYRYAESRILFDVMLNVVILSVIILILGDAMVNVVVLSVMAPFLLDY